MVIVAESEKQIEREFWVAEKERGGGGLRSGGGCVVRICVVSVVCCKACDGVYFCGIVNVQPEEVLY